MLSSRGRIPFGFTLIELLISAAIITIISSIVLVRFNSFDSTVLLKSLAYEVATSIREAQIYSVSVINSVGGAQANFRYPYGVSFTQNAQSYTFFRFDNANTAVTPSNTAGQVTLLKTIAFSGSMKVADVCVVGGATEYCASYPVNNISRLDISFRRPEFFAIFNAPGSSGTISEGKIKLCSTRNPANMWVVKVTLLGQITVYKDISGSTCS